MPEGRPSPPTAACAAKHAADRAQPPRLHIIGRHLQNHFEVPPLVHLGVLQALVTGAVSPHALAFAWLYVGARCVHSFIHLGSNNVNHRFMAFRFSLLMLAGFWGSVLLHLVATTQG